MDRNLKIFFSGFFLWLVSFILSVPLYPRGELVYDLQVTKSNLNVVGGFLCTLFAFRYFGNVKADFAREGAILGSAWFAISSAFDILVFVYLVHVMDLTTWARQIGIRYLLMPIMTTAMGAAMGLRGK